MLNFMEMEIDAWLGGHQSWQELRAALDDSRERWAAFELRAAVADANLDAIERGTMSRGVVAFCNATTVVLRNELATLVDATLVDATLVDI